ncbi:Cof-type HAD-IIB family hydrolase [Clostridium sp. LBM24168]
MGYKLIAVDMDGTLLNDKKIISYYNGIRIRKALEVGVKFVLCSGRMPGGIKIYAEAIVKHEPIICCNGAVILDDSGSIMYSSPISKNSILEIIDVLREEKDTYYHFYDEDTIYTEQFGSYMNQFYKFNRKLDRKFRSEIRIIADAKKFIKESDKRVNKLVVVDNDNNYLTRLRKKMEMIPGLEITRSNVNNIEITNKGISKGYGVALLSGYYNIPLEECISIGNDENDISMIRISGVGVAVANASETVKDYADYITLNDNNHGAIGEVIDKFILN